MIAIEPVAGELLLFAANSDDVFIPGALATRLEPPHVCRILARSGLDWSALLNLPAFDHAALGEVCDESPRFANSAFKGQLAGLAPLEVMRWGNKQQEIQTALTGTRITPAPFWQNAQGQSNRVDEEIHLSRQSRLVEWLGNSRVSQELLRRLGEVVTQQKLVREFPDAHWWAYRKALRKQLQDRPRTIVQPVKAIDDKQTMHPEDLRRRLFRRPRAMPLAGGNRHENRSRPSKSFSNRTIRCSAISLDRKRPSCSRGQAKMPHANWHIDCT